MQSAFENRVWLTWLVKVRILILTVLLGMELAIAEFTPVGFPIRLFADAILLAYTISAFYLVLLHFWDELKPQAVLQVITDLLLVSLLVYITGGVDSELNFLYPLVILVASILLPRVWAYLTAAFAFILYGAVLELEAARVVVLEPHLRLLQLGPTRVDRSPDVPRLAVRAVLDERALAVHLELDVLRVHVEQVGRARAADD